MGEYRVTIKVRNDLILRAIANAGGEPGWKWCNANGLSYVGVNDLINLTASPLDKKLNLRPVAANLCEVLGVMPEDLWTEEQLRPLEKNMTDLEMGFEQVAALVNSGKAGFLDDGFETPGLVQEALAALPTRLREVIEMRFGFGSDVMTLKKVAAKFGVGAERVRQMEARAIRDLRRHMSMAGIRPEDL